MDLERFYSAAHRGHECVYTGLIIRHYV